jgi:hypothetical protein
MQQHCSEVRSFNVPLSCSHNPETTHYQVLGSDKLHLLEAPGSIIPSGYFEVTNGTCHPDDGPLDRGPCSVDPSYLGAVTVELECLLLSCNNPQLFSLFGIVLQSSRLSIDAMLLNQSSSRNSILPPSLNVF